jgi:hypothetical protein
MVMIGILVHLVHGGFTGIGRVVGAALHGTSEEDAEELV